MAAHALVYEWCDGRVMWGGAVPASSTCLALSLLLSALGLVSVCAHLHGYVLLKLPDYVCLCKDMVPKAPFPPGAGCPCLPAYIYLCVTGFVEMLIALLLGIL